MKYYDCGVFRGKRCVVTEWVQPIRPLLKQLDSDVIVSGVHNIVSGLSFIHSTCHLSVNNLNLDSIFISRSENTNSWKIGSLLCLSSVNTENNEFSKRLLSYHNYLGTTNTLPIEDLVSNRIEFIQSNDNIHRRDAFALGLIINQLLSDHSRSEVVKSLTSEVVSNRPQMDLVLNDELFIGSDYVQIKSFLTSFVSYNESQKNQFFSNLVERLRKLSDNLVVSLVALIVNSRLIMSNSEVHNKLLPFVLIPGSDSSEEMLCTLTSGQSISLKPLLRQKVFRTRIIPLICKLYCVRDLRIRLLLLQYLPNYAPFISKSCLRQLILPQILLAMKDSNDELVSLTFRSISLLVDIFGASVVLGPRLRLFTNGIPKVYSSSEDLNVKPLDLNISESSVPNNLSKERGNYEFKEKFECNSLTSNASERSSVSDEESQFGHNDQSQVESEVKPSDTKPEIASSKTKRYANIRNDLDIKELDFNLESNQIDDLFSDMEPVFKFNKNNLIPDVLDNFDSGVSTSNKFAATEDNTEEIGWDDHEWEQHWSGKDDK